MTDKKSQRIISIEGADPRVLFGRHGVYLTLIEARLGVGLTARGEEVIAVGTPEHLDVAARLFGDLFAHIEKTGELSERYLHYAMTVVAEGGEGPSAQLETNGETAGANRQRIAPKTLGQKSYLDAIENFDITICIGPAGTGKTYLAVAMAVAEWKAKLVSRIILARPAVEAGESLGFLPGDIRAKVDPYLRPVYDALYDMMAMEKMHRLMEDGTIEIVPLAFMRGRTLNNAFVILDEAQNTTAGQMKMFLTRLGERSKAVVTGDVTQVDLVNPSSSGLILASRILQGIKGIGFVQLTEKDVVRHRLVASIINAFERHEQAGRDRAESAENQGPARRNRRR
ncbi:MAG: PhoH family protein [candidate division Zixibacteria bacterium]|nr:PhoH family protein [candidate division Zixibacteria bacterium]